MGWQLSALASAARATTPGTGAVAVRIDSISTDSRSVSAGALFVALRGDNFDGHGFVDAAVRSGARAVMVDEKAAPTMGHITVPRLVVPDTLRALGDMAAWARLQHAKPLAAVTGSNGKTTTKELLAAALGCRGLVHKTAGNLNNLIGVPHTLFGWSDAAWAAVVEMGMNAPGEIARLTEIAKPNVGLVTCVAAAHLGGPGLGSLAAIAKAKSELFAGLPGDATVVLNADDAALMAAATPVLGQRRVVRFGRTRGCDVRVLGCDTMATSITVHLEVGGKKISSPLPLIGAHNAMNAAGALGAAWALSVPPEDIAAALPRVKVPGARLRVVAVPHRQITIIDDTYNANPASMVAAFAAQADVAAGGRRLAALGDMLELGDEAAALHRAVGAAAAAAGVVQVFALGPLADATVKGAREGGALATRYPAVEDLCSDLNERLRPGDVLLVKGSRGMRMERVVQWLTEEHA